MRTAAIIPCFRVKNQILSVIAGIGPEVSAVFVVDDACPEKTGQWVKENCSDTRVTIISLPHNQGVGGATLAGFSAAIDAGADILVKIDGDGQMDPKMIRRLVAPIRKGLADYCKGNRFSRPEHLRLMPKLRLFGNAALSFITKASTGYWKIMDPTNGFCAIHSKVFAALASEKLEKRFFFETDMLYRLRRLRARVYDVPMTALYGDEKSNLQVARVLPEFSNKHVRTFIKRIINSYFIEDFNVGTIELLLGILLLGFGMTYGGLNWYHNAKLGHETGQGTIMVAAVPFILGFQLCLSFLHYDIENEPSTPLHPTLTD